MEDRTDLVSHKKLFDNSFPEVSVSNASDPYDGATSKAGIDSARFALWPDESGSYSLRNVIPGRDMVKSVLPKQEHYNSVPTMDCPANDCFGDGFKMAANGHYDYDKLLSSTRKRDAITKLAVICPASNPSTGQTDGVEEVQVRPRTAVTVEKGDNRVLNRGNRSPILCNRSWDVASNDLTSPSRHSNVFELAFLQNAEKTGLLFTQDGVGKSAASGTCPLMVSTSASSANGDPFECPGATLHADKLQLDCSSSFDIVRSRNMGVSEKHQKIQVRLFRDFINDDSVRCPGVLLDERLEDDVKLWCRTYVKLVDCANLLFLTIPAAVRNTGTEAELLRTIKSENLTPFDSCSPTEPEVPLPVFGSGLDSTSVFCSSDRSNICDDSDSFSDVGQRKRWQRSGKASRGQSRTRNVSRRRKVVGVQKNPLSQDQDEVVCTLDTWKKVHRSKAKADKQSSKHAANTETTVGVTIKQEPLEDFDDLVFRNQRPITPNVFMPVQEPIKSELTSEADTVNSISPADPSLTLITLQPKPEITKLDTAFIKKEPHDFSYYESSDPRSFGQKLLNTLFPDDITPQSSAETAAQEAGYEVFQIMQDEQLQPCVMLERFPVWILHRLQSSDSGLNSAADHQQPSVEEVPQWSSFIEKSSEYNDASDSVYLKGYSLKPDEMNFKPETVVASSVSHDPQAVETLSQKREASPSENLARPRSKRLKSDSPRTRRKNVSEGRRNTEESLVENSGSVSDGLQQARTDAGEELKVGTNRRIRSRSTRGSEVKSSASGNGESSLAVDAAVKDSEDTKNENVLEGQQAEKVSKVASVEKKLRNVRSERASRCEVAAKVRKGELNEKVVTGENVGKKSLRNSKKDNTRIERTAKSQSQEKQLPAAEEKKSNAKIGFVIPKKKPPDSTTSASVSRNQEKTAVRKVNSLTWSLPRIPKTNKALSDDDKERSVLAKLDKATEKPKGLNWDSKVNWWPGKVTEKLHDSAGDLRGLGLNPNQRPEEKWQHTGNDWFTVQNVQPRGNFCVPLLAPKTMQPAVVENAETSKNPARNFWNNLDQVFGNVNYGFGAEHGVKTSTGSIPTQQSGWMSEQRPMPTVGRSIPVIQSANWARNLDMSSRGTVGPHPPEPPMQGRTDPVLCDVSSYVDDPYENFSGSCGDDDDEEEGNVVRQESIQLRVDSLGPSASVTAHNMPPLRDLSRSENMDDSIRLLVEAVQEAVEQGDVSPQKCNRLLNLYETLCKDLDIDNATASRKKEAAGIICDRINRSVLKDSKVCEKTTKLHLKPGSLSTVSVLQDVDQRSWPASNSATYGQDRDFRNRRLDFDPDATTVGDCSIDDLTRRTLDLLEDEAAWQGLLAQSEELSVSEENIEMVRRLLLEAARKGVCDDRLTHMMTEVCQHIQLEDKNMRLSSKKDFDGRRHAQNRLHADDVEIPFLTNEHHSVDNKSGYGSVHRKEESRLLEDSPRMAMTPRSGSVEARGSDELVKKSSAERPAGLEDAEEKASRALKQETIAARIKDEVQLIEMLVTIHCELTDAAVSESSHALPAAAAAESECGMPVTPSVGLLDDSSYSHASNAEHNPSASEKTSSETCDTPSVASESFPYHPSISASGDGSQDSYGAKKITRDKETVVDKKSTDPKLLEDKVISMARNALKPHYHNGAITSEEFKVIMKKAIAKICNSRSTDISQKRIAKFINAYVDKIIQSRRK